MLYEIIYLLNQLRETNIDELQYNKLKVVLRHAFYNVTFYKEKYRKKNISPEKIKNLDKYVFSSALANIKLKNVHIAPYIYSILYILSENFEKDLCTASQYPRFSPKLLNNIKIPIIKIQTFVSAFFPYIGNVV